MKSWLWSVRTRLFARQDLHGGPGAPSAQPAQVPVHSVEQRGYALHREHGPPDHLHEPADGARREAHQHRRVMGEQEEAAAQALSVLHDQVHPAVESSHSAVVHDEKRRAWARIEYDEPEKLTNKDTGLEWVYTKQWVACMMRESKKEKNPKFRFSAQMNTSCEIRQLVTLCAEYLQVQLLKLTDLIT